MSGAPLDLQQFLEKLGAPADIAAGVSRLRERLIAAAGPDLAGLILYGGLARGRFRPGKSDVNLAVLLRQASAGALRAIAVPLREARRAARVEPFILTLGEVRFAVDVFPAKVLDIHDHHHLLHGEDPFAALRVPAEHLRRHVERGLRGLTLDLRRRYVRLHGDPAGLAEALGASARPLAVLLACLFRLFGKQLDDDLTVPVFRAASEAFDLDREALERVAALREDPRPAEDLAAVFERVLESIAQAAEAADRMEGTQS